MKQYETYKDSGAEWIGEIPESWKSVNLKWISNITKGKKPKVDFDENGENLLPYLSMEFLRGKTSNPTYASIEEKGLVHIDDGDILILWDGSKAGEIVKAKKGILSSTMAKIEINDNNFESNYLNYLLQLGERHVQEHTIGMGIPHVSGDILKMLPMLVPSSQEQTQIANYLDYKTGLIDAIIAQKEDLIKKLKEQRQAIINEAVTKGLNKDVKLKDSGIEWLGDIPEHWEVVKLRYLSDITTGDKDTENREDDAKYPFFVRSQTIERISSYSFDGEAILTAGDGVGVCKVWHYINGKFDYHQRVYMMHNFRKVTGIYLFNFMKENFINEVLKLSAKSTVDSLRRPMFLDFPVAVPPMDEQSSIIDVLINKQKLIDNSIEEIISSIQKLKEYRQSLISEAVTGKIDVRDWQAPKS